MDETKGDAKQRDKIAKIALAISFQDSKCPFCQTNWIWRNLCMSEALTLALSGPITHFDMFTT